jgi:hypothetical protein
VTLRNAPLGGTGWEGYSGDLGFGKTEIFFLTGLEREIENPSDLPVGQNLDLSPRSRHGLVFLVSAARA